MQTRHVHLEPQYTPRVLQTQYLKACFSIYADVFPQTVMVHYDDDADRIYVFLSTVVRHEGLGAEQAHRYIMQIHSDSDIYSFWDDNGDHAVFPMVL